MSMAVDQNCDFVQNMVVGQTYYIYNPEYEYYYGPSASCRWIANSPVGTKIILTCEDIELPVSQNCNGDRLSISVSGSPTFVDSHNYCGKGELSIVTSKNKLAIALISTPSSTGGRFLCSATTVDDGSGTTTPRPNSCDCGWTQKRRIVGGVETGVNEYPAMAGMVDLQKKKVTCGATLISNRYAISAAHCVTNNRASNVAILVGDHDLTTDQDSPSASLYVLERIIIHQFYNSARDENDISILKTQNKMTFNLDVGPICLPFRYSDVNFAGATGTILGWGTTDFSNPSSDVLLAANLTIITNTECQRRLPSNSIFTSQICTYEPGKDACQLDSGGPLLWYDPTSRRQHLIGVISFGRGCATLAPGVNVRVTSYLQWIVQVTGDTQYCIK